MVCVSQNVFMGLCRFSHFRVWLIMSPKAGSAKEEVDEKVDQKDNVEGKSRFNFGPEFKTRVKDFFVGTFGLGLVGGGLFGSLVFFAIFNLVGYYCVADSYLLSEKSNILFFSIRLLVGVAFVAGVVFSLVFLKSSNGKYRKILLAVFLVEIVFAGGFVLAFETPHCKNFQTLISSKPLTSGEVTVLDEKQLTADESYDTLAVWSSDSSKLAFLRERPMMFDGSLDIWVINKDGGNLRQLVSGSIEIEHPTWSPDGKRIAYAALTSGNRQIWVDDVLSGSRVQITNDKLLGHVSPSWSPNIDEIAYLKVGPNDMDIWITDSAGEDHRQLTSGDGIDKGPSWSPDGSRIVFVRMSDGSGDIWLINKDGSGLSQLTSGDTSKSHPMFSPDGSKIAFLSRPPQPSASSLISGKKNGGQYDTLWIMNFDGSGVRQLSLDRVDGDYSWSPRGDMIAFVKLSENAANLWVISADGSNEKMLTLSQPFPTNPAWSPDGSSTVYSVFGPGHRNLWEALLAQ